MNRFLTHSLAWLIIFNFFTAVKASELSRSFEVRYFTDDPKADGETDFTGETAWLNTDQRVEFLRQYAEYAKKFFHDPNLDTIAVDDSQVQNALQKLKPQPSTKVRQRIELEEWKWIGFRPDQRQENLAAIREWQSIPGVSITDGFCTFQSNAKIRKSFDPQNWRFFLQWRARLSKPGIAAQFSLANSVSTGAAIVMDMKIEDVADRWVEFKLEVDLVEGRYNLYRDNQRIIDFVPFDKEQIQQFDVFTIHACQGLQFDDLWGVGYHPTGREAQPFEPHTFIDVHFEVKPEMRDWASIDYDDSAWQTGMLPIVNGGERYMKEDLYLRKVIEPGEFERAVLEAEALDPAGELWINGQVITIRKDRHPFQMDITDHLRKNEKNILAVRVKYFQNNPEDFPHSPSDPYIGWFAGRMWLNLRKTDYIDDVFVYTTEVGDSAQLQTRITLANEWKEDRFQGSVEVNLYPWFPEESQTAAASITVPVTVTEFCTETISPVISVPNPKLWTVDNPQLYKVEVILRDSQNNPVDDYVFTTGIRKISQDGGVLKINNQVEMMNGAGIFQFLYPFDKIAAWNRCAPMDWLVRQVLMVKAMNGNAMRIHVHAWGHIPPARNINDPRLAEMGDQLGLMFQWGTTGWIRSGTPWGMDFEGYAKDIRLVRNHPSIIIWEGCNHPTVGQKYDRKPEGWIKALNKIHETIYSNDPSRLIIPIARFAQISRGAHDWTAPNVAWGNMDCQLGNDSVWTHLRKWPHSDKWPKDFPAKRLVDPDRAYICTEHQEAMGQDNTWLARGKPWYKIHSYEWKYDETSIGRRLSFEEWQQSQAWQAIAVYEPIKKMRWLDYDGFFWCCLRGGPNCATYRKPLIDYMGHAKLSWYAHRMAFQRILAGSGDVDTVYGPGDAIHPIVMNYGPRRIVDVAVQIKHSINDTILTRQDYPHVTLEAERTVTHLEPFQSKDFSAGYYIVEYSVRDYP